MLRISRKYDTNDDKDKDKDAFTKSKEKGLDNWLLIYGFEKKKMRKREWRGGMVARKRVSPQKQDERDLILQKSKHTFSSHQKKRKEKKKLCLSHSTLETHTRTQLLYQNFIFFLFYYTKLMIKETQTHLLFSLCIDFWVLVCDSNK